MSLDKVESVEGVIKKLANPLQELRKYTQFANVQPELLSEVKIAYIFGKDQTTGIFVTGDDEVYSIGNNQYGRLGIGSLSPVDSLTPLKIEALCGQNVAGFSCGSVNGYCFALTNCGLVYAWRFNEQGELGLGTTTNTFVPTLVDGLRDKKVVQISCGFGQPLALTSEGEVYSWGYNDHGQIGNGTTQAQPTPVKVCLCDDVQTVKISEVAAGYYYSIALSLGGEVYAWGCNYNGQLGNGTTVNAARPVKIALPDDVKIAKIACGQYYTLALGKNGKLFSWGKNKEYQLGNGTNTDILTPTEVQGVDNVIEIAALNYKYDISVCITTQSKVYLWGAVPGRVITRPIETTWSQMHDVIWLFSKPQEVMYKPLHFYPFDQISPSLAVDVAMAFDEQCTSDIKFVSQNEEESVHVHKSILEIRSTYFRTMFAGEWKETLENSIEIDPSIRFTTFRALLYFLYTDKIQFPQDDLKNITDLLKLADLYIEKRMREECELILKRGITVNNAVELFSLASKHNANELEEFAYKFILSHRGQIPFEEELEKLELDLNDYKKLVIGLAKAK